MLYARGFAENFLIVTDVYIFMLNYNTLRDTAEDKEFTIAIQMTLEHVLVQRSKKIKIKKVTFNNTYNCYKSSKFHWKNDLAKSLFVMKQTSTEFSSQKFFNIRGLFRTLPNISDGIFLRK